MKTQAISVNFADTMMRRGVYPMMPPLPFIPGLEASDLRDKGLLIVVLHPSGEALASFLTTIVWWTSNN